MVSLHRFSPFYERSERPALLPRRHTLNCRRNVPSVGWTLGLRLPCQDDDGQVIDVYPSETPEAAVTVTFFKQAFAH